ncbi:hypothetical protein CC86DRAFT_413918 [Ophiobolus disseminans]|uniref:Uncharacterized protein n=1 Tax=Ophiobolus disseminans TaxID=1469910 RepID=A0A6A6ZCH6_9PLEO|nr:hypothetical protein CC86DRAFT_413918 [Ophiobolus disseminans]
MPAISHLVARQFSSGSSGGISTTAIGLIVGIGIIPVFILIWVVSWLFWCYPYNRTCCCTRRKKKQPDPEMTEQNDGTITSDETLHEKRMDIPQRPVTTYRTETGSSYGVNGGVRLTKTDPRLSMQTVDSSYTGRTTQEPKPFV